MKNRYKAYPFLLALLPVFGPAVSAAQPANEADVPAMVVDIGQLMEGFGEELDNALKSVDWTQVAADAEKIAALSERHVRDIRREVEQLDFGRTIHEHERLARKLSRLDRRLALEHNGRASAVYRKEKVTEYSYPVSSRQSVSIDNRYGKVNINNWENDEVKVVVTVHTAEHSERRAEEALNRVRIDQSKSASTIAFKTMIESGDSNWWNIFSGGTDDRSLSIDYDVYLPRHTELTLGNRYGDIVLPDREGPVNVSVSYGNLHAGRLNGLGNNLSLSYSKGDVDYLKEGSVTVRYGGFTLSGAEQLSLSMSSSNGKIGKVDQLADISLRYSGGFEMTLGTNIKKVDVAAAYSNVRIRPAADARFKFDVAVSYGGFDYDPDHAHVDSKSETYTSASYSGYWNHTATSTVSISARYGTVNLK